MIKTDFNKWTYRDFVQFSTALTSGADSESQKLLMKVVTAWDYDVALSEGAVDELYPLEAAQVFHDAAIAMNDAIQRLDTSIVIVDFKRAGWRNKRFKEFQKARSEQNAPMVEDMLREICSMEGFTPEDERPLTFSEGTRFVRAVMETYQNVLSGKV